MRHTLALLLFGLINTALIIEVPIQSLPGAASAAIATSAMAFSLLLSNANGWLDRLCGSADNRYRWHRWLGVTAVIGTLIHWPLADESGQALLPGLADGAAELGEFVAVVLLILALISATRVIPYRWWRYSHQLMGPLFLLAAYHGIFSPNPGVNTALLSTVCFVGVSSWLTLLWRRRRPLGEFTASDVKLDGSLLDITLPGSEALTWIPGQHVHVKLPGQSTISAKPFTIASAPGQPMRLLIRIKGSGTQLLAKQLSCGESLQIQSIQGSFCPSLATDKPAQVWLACGVGITPFLAALEAMSPDTSQSLTLLYCPAVGEASISQQLQAHAERLPQLKLQLYSSNKRLELEHLSALAAQAPADLYVCGSAGLEKLAREAWSSQSGKVICEQFERRGSWTLERFIGERSWQWLERVSALAATSTKGDFNALLSNHWRNVSVRQLWEK